MTRTTDMTLYTNGDTVWTYEQMRDEVFPAEIEGVDMDQFIGGELSFEDSTPASTRKSTSRGLAVADLSREASKRLGAELAKELGYYPASLAPEDVARYREQ